MSLKYLLPHGNIGSAIFSCCRLIHFAKRVLFIYLFNECNSYYSAGVFSSLRVVVLYSWLECVCLSRPDSLGFAGSEQGQVSSSCRVQLPKLLIFFYQFAGWYKLGSFIYYFVVTACSSINGEKYIYFGTNKLGFNLSFTVNFPWTSTFLCAKWTQ